MRRPFPPEPYTRKKYVCSLTKYARLRVREQGGASLQSHYQRSHEPLSVENPQSETRQRVVCVSCILVIVVFILMSNFRNCYFVKISSTKF